MQYQLRKSIVRLSRTGKTGKEIAKDILKPLIDKGVNVVFLPIYSPDFNPIELAWSKIKAYLRKMKARKPAELFEAISNALDTITESDILGWINHCGYGL